MSPPSLTLDLSSPDDTAELAARIADLARPGDVVLLDGPVGAGKTHFARAFVHSLQTSPEPVPSPTYTLVQNYETRKGPVWHADLYRIGALDELEELGLTEAFESDICLVEWPERLGPLKPPAALELALAGGSSDESRVATLSWQDPRLERLRSEAAA